MIWYIIIMQAKRKNKVYFHVFAGEYHIQIDFAKHNCYPVRLHRSIVNETKLTIGFQLELVVSTEFRMV